MGNSLCLKLNGNLQEIKIILIFIDRNCPLCGTLSSELWTLTHVEQAVGEKDVPSCKINRV